MLHVYLARHGETVWNTESRMQGRQDSPLTAAGLRQAFELAGRLRGVPLDEVVTSPAPRALRVAEIVAEAQPRPVPVHPDERIHEMALGDLEGLTVDQANALDPDNMQAFFYEPHKFTPVDGGEDFHQVSARMADFLASLTAEAERCSLSGDERHVLVVSHNITLKALFALMDQRPLAMLRDGPPISQGRLYHAVWHDGRWHIGLHVVE